MQIETVPIESISSDPANARKHGAKNLAAIKNSLRRFGQQKPIVVDADGVVRADNGTLAAATALGWKEICVIRTALVGSEATAYAIADNRSGELAEWDEDMLSKELTALDAENFSLGDIGFDETDLKKLLDDQAPMDLELGEQKWLVVVTCKDEADQVAFLEQMSAVGRECRALLG
jgi:ParB-like chromosome segregation protein Spo0J